MTQSTGPASSHTARLHHHLRRTREHRALITQAATEAARAHYADRSQSEAATGQSEPTKGAPNE